MATIEQIRANRENAQHSTGPSSPRGKKASRMNATRHGFAGQTVIIPDHEQEAYERHFAAFRREHTPVGPTEEFLVQSLAEYSWAIQQIRAALTNRTYLAGASPLSGVERTNGPEIDNAMGQAYNVVQLADAFSKFGLYEQRKARAACQKLSHLCSQQSLLFGPATSPSKRRENKKERLDPEQPIENKANWEEVHNPRRSLQPLHGTDSEPTRGVETM
jgi:hypothetical protein